MIDNFTYIFKNDLKNNLKFLFNKSNKWYWFLFIAVIILLTINVQKDISIYQSVLKDIKSFNKIEKYKPKLYPHYTWYGTIGIYHISAPATISCLSFACTMVSHLDTGAGLKVYNDLKKDGMLSDIEGFLGLTTFFISFISLIFGTRTFKNRKLIFFFKSIKELKKDTAFWAIYLSRFTQISIILWLLFLLAYLQCIANGISLNILPLVKFVLLLELIIIFFLAIGFISDFYIQRLKTFYALFFFFVGIFLIPIQIEKFSRTQNNSFQLEMLNIEQITSFEKLGFKEVGNYKSGKPAPDKVKKLIERVQKVEHEIIRKNEEKLYLKLKEQIKLKHFLNSLLPPTFIISCSKEQSGCKDIGLLNFILFSQNAKKSFTSFIFKKKFYEKSERGKVEPFPESQVFNTQPVYPFYFTFGIFMTIFWNLFFIYIAYCGFLHRLENRKNREEDFFIPLQSKKMNYFLTRSDELKSMIFKMFLNKDKHIIIDDNKENTFDDFIYLPEPHHLPPDAEKLMGGEPDTNKPRWESLLRAALKTKKIVIAANWKLENFDDLQNKRLEDLITQGTILFIGDDQITHSLADNPINYENDESVTCLNLRKLAERFSERAGLSN